MTTDNEILMHHGIKGQRWGIRRFQNEDGTRTAAGKKRERSARQQWNAERKMQRKAAGSGKLFDKNESRAAKKYKEAKSAEKKALNEFDGDYDKYDKKVNAAFDKRVEAFKDSKNQFKANKTAGQKLANGLLNGPLGAGIYNNMRASGHSVAASEGAVIASTLLGGPIGQAGAYILTRKGA